MQYPSQPSIIPDVITPEIASHSLAITLPWSTSKPLNGSEIGYRMFGGYDAAPDWNHRETKHMLQQIASIGIDHIDRYAFAMDLLELLRKRLIGLDGVNYAVGLVITLDQGGRYLCGKGTNARYIYHLFDVLIFEITDLLLRERPDIFRLATWTTWGITSDHAVLRILMLLPPLAHSDRPGDIQRLLDVTENLRREYELVSGTVDPYRGSYEHDLNDLYLICRLLAKGPPQGDGVSSTDFIYWMMRYYTSHMGYANRFGRNPGRNIATGRSDAPGEVEWLEAFGTKRTQEDEITRNIIRSDIEKGTWTKLDLTD